MRMLKELPRLRASITSLRVVSSPQATLRHDGYAVLHDHSTVRPGGPFERGDKVRVSAAALHSFNRRGEVLGVRGGAVEVLLESGARSMFTPWELTKVASL